MRFFYLILTLISFTIFLGSCTNCETDSDCLKNESCTTSSHKCEKQSSDCELKCDHWKDCTIKGELESCELKAGMCDNNIDCTDGKICNNHYCENKCGTNYCKEWEECAPRNICVLIDGRCNDNNDCTNNKVCDINTHSCENKCKNINCDSWKKCEESTGNCILKNGSCESNIDCYNSQTCNITSHSCENKSCDLECVEWKECIINTNEQICSLKENRCEDNGNCSNNETCNKDSHSCESKCKNISCDSWKKCEENTGKCILKNGACESYTDCSNGQKCNNHYCVENSSPNNAKIIFLHHSTGGRIWNGGENVIPTINTYNTQHGTNFSIIDKNYPKDSSYGVHANYPYDYWSIWVEHAGNSTYKGQETLEMLTPNYDLIVWKHCFPVSDILEDTNPNDISSKHKSLGNYKLQYNALKLKMKEFSDTKFLVWTGAARVSSSNQTFIQRAERAREFANWVKNVWDEPNDNIFVFDFRQLETEGGLFLLAQYAQNSSDSHPNTSFSATIGPKFAKRILDVLTGKGNTGSLTGE